MAFVRSETGSGHAASVNWTPPRSSRLARWALVTGIGALFAFASLGALAGLVFLATSLTSPADFAPNAQKAATPDHLALAAGLYSPPAQKNCQAACRQRTQYIVQQAKASRTAVAVDKHLDAASLAAEAAAQRFEQKKRASLTPGKLAEALTRARTETGLSLAARHRFYPPVQSAALAQANHPDAARFGHKIPEAERSSRLALALAGAGTLQVAYPVHTASLGLSMPLLAPEADENSLQAADIASSAFEPVPQSAPLPALRPEIRTAPAEVATAMPRQPAAVATAVPRRPAKPLTRRGADQQALAYAAPDDGSPSQAFKNLFATPGAGNGVAVYDISAQTVTMPDGSVLEAHSGIGRMADDPRYVNQKMNGPTPPNTYKLVMRESRFYGVEAIRMLPTEPRKMHGRDGILAHSYLLRGRTGQSHGCVAFADYDRFLKAFKQGKVKHMVVVPGSGKAPARIAKNGRGV